MDRLIIESIEGRIMLGITMFVAIMVLVGWIAINEPARMAEFVEQHEGRSIERGAELYAANCSTCHGNNGYGQGGVAPALNNPHFFGYNYLGEINTEIATLQRQFNDINGVVDVSGVPNQIGTQELLENRRDELLDDLAEASDSDAEDILIELLHVEAQLSDDIDQVAARIEAIEAGEPIGDDAEPALSDDELAVRLDALESNIPTRLASIEENLPDLLAERDRIIEEDLSQAVLRGYLPRLDAVRAEAEEAGYPLFVTNYIDAESSRLGQIAFGGDLGSYVTTTLIHGRPGSNVVWPQPMVSWSQRGGGPLRDDQIGDVVSYILNWDKGSDWSIDDFNAVNQYALLYTPYTGETDSDFEAVGDDVVDIAANLPEGDAANGEALYNGTAPVASGTVIGCSACHAGGAVGPATEGTWTRVQNQRLALPEFAEYTAEEYLVESIVLPAAYSAPGGNGAMPQGYGDQMSLEDLADLIAYLRTQNQ